MPGQADMKRRALIGQGTMQGMAPAGQQGVPLGSPQGAPLGGQQGMQQVMSGGPQPPMSSISGQTPTSQQANLPGRAIVKGKAALSIE